MDEQPGGQVGALLFAGIIGANKSGMFDRNNERKYLTTQNLTHNTLPTQYVLAQNPYEYVGDFHNKSLNLIVRLGGINKVRDSLFNYDVETWQAFIDLDSRFSNLDARATTSCARTNMPRTLLEEMSNRIQNTRSTEGYVAYTNTISQADVDYLEETVHYYIELKSSNASDSEIYGYLNSKITPLLAREPTTQTDGIIIYLTVLKHSDYYWD